MLKYGTRDEDMNAWPPADPWMIGTLVFAATLLLAVLLSALSARSVLSASALFLVVGFFCGAGGLGIIHLDVEQPLVQRFVELALFSILFTDGMRVNRRMLGAWRLPARALVPGIPLTVLVIALFAHFVAGLDWLAAFLLGAALSPTDPVFAAAILGHESVPRRVRHLLNVESGLNDGLALPIVLVLLAMQGGEASHGFALVAELLGGVGIGVFVPWLALWLEKSPLFKSRADVRPMLAVGVGLLVLSLTSLTQANSFLAAFTAGIFLGCADEKLVASFHGMGELIADAFKFAALLVFAALLTPALFADIGWAGCAFVLLALVAARPIALAISLAGTKLSRHEWLTAAWFGPRGFASVFFGLLILHAGGPDAQRIFHLLAVTVVASMIAHSSTDVLVARSFVRP
jgi:NhaP-type Na+/H+ or K+/H+ antiporter